MKRLFLLVGIIGIVVVAKAQSQQTSQTLEDLLEAAGETMGDETDIQEILDDWEDLKEKPLNANTATKEDFQRLHLLSEIQANKLIAYRNKTGTIYSLYELLAVDGLSQDVLTRIEPFLIFENSAERLPVKKPATDILSRLTRTFNQSDPGKYEGSAERYYLRLKHVSSALEYGWICEKDPGEAFLRKSNRQGFDYNSAFINWGLGQNKHRLFVGDYTVRFGQGLVAWQGFSMGKSVETTQVFRSAPGIRSYTSTDENQFFRGFAARLNQRKFSFLPFVSFHKIDASIDTIEGTRYFGALQTSGYHRTNTEVQNEKALSQFAAGAHLTIQSGNWTIGGTALYTRFNAFMDRGYEPYNQFLPEGKDNTVAGFDWKGSLRKAYLFGEGAISRNSGRALISGLTMSLAPNAEVSLVYRNINRTYFSYLSNAFTESSRVNDEHGLYMGVRIYPASRLIFQAYTDFFRFNWLKYTTAAPSNGTELLVQLTFAPSRKTNYYLRFFQEEKDQRLIDNKLKYNVTQRINRIRLNFSHDVTGQISLKSRAECSFYSKETREKGILVFQDIAYRPIQKTFSVNGRLAYFSTDGYNSRLYACESDLLYSFAVPAFYNKGVRACLNIQKEINQSITFWIKLASTRQLAQNNVNESTGKSLKSEMKFQVRYHF